MDAFPPDVRPPDGRRLAGLICPDCGGSITVSERDGSLVFQCRVGHLYTLEDMVIGKEAHIEHTMWAAIHAYAEMAAFLRNIGERPDQPASIIDSERARRAEQAETNATLLREILEKDRRMLLSEPVEGEATAP